MFHRLPGSIGSSAYPSRVYPGTRSSGRMGGKQVTTKNLEVVKVDAENHLIYLRGAVPGARNAVIKIVKKAPRTRAA
jgi:large subunit ribosomal protein L3